MAEFNYEKCDFEKYDFTEDWPVNNTKLDEYKKMGIWEKYFTYQMSHKKPKESYDKANDFWLKRHYYNIPDPDTNSEKLQEKYHALWLSDSLECCTDNENRIHGDTMNSILTTLSWYVCFCYEKDQRYYAGERGNGFVRKDNGKKYSGSLSQSLQIFMDLSKKEGRKERENDFKEKYDLKKGEEKFLKVGSDDSAVEVLKEFIKYNHTLGNFIPIPFETNGGSFNRPRAATTNDFWDLTLYRIYCWYGKNTDMNKVQIEKCDCEKNKDLCDLLGKNCQNVKLCIRWLKAFENWHEFVEKNYLAPYVVTENDGSWGIPKLLWCNDKNYDFEKNQTATESDMKKLWYNRIKNNKCRDEAVCEQYFKNATKCIKKRTEIMKKKLEENGKL